MPKEEKPWGDEMSTPEKARKMFREMLEKIRRDIESLEGDDESDPWVKEMLLEQLRGEEEVLEGCLRLYENGNLLNRLQARGLE